MRSAFLSIENPYLPALNDEWVDCPPFGQVFVAQGFEFKDEPGSPRDWRNARALMEGRLYHADAGRVDLWTKQPLRYDSTTSWGSHDIVGAASGPVFNYACERSLNFDEQHYYYGIKRGK